MIVATLKTEHFEFTAAGQTGSAARRNVMDGFRRHLAEYDSSAERWVEQMNDEYSLSHARYDVARFAACVEDWYGVNVVELSPGVCLRDGKVV